MKIKHKMTNGVIILIVTLASNIVLANESIWTYTCETYSGTSCGGSGNTPFTNSAQNPATLTSPAHSQRVKVQCMYVENGENIYYLPSQFTVSCSPTEAGSVNSGLAIKNNYIFNLYNSSGDEVQMTISDVLCNGNQAADSTLVTVLNCKNYIVTTRGDS